MEKLIEKHYGLRVRSLARVSQGVGGDVYFVDTDQGRFVLKGVERGDIYAKNEPRIAAFLARRDIPVAEYLPTRGGAFFFSGGRRYHLQRFVEGTVYSYGEAPAWLITESARMLGRIHSALADHTPLPLGMGPDFFAFLRSDTPRARYTKTLARARAAKDASVIADVEFRLAQLHKLRETTYDYARFTVGNTHGDYKISQIICGSGHIAAVVDWTAACTHPLCLEIIRSYAHAAPAFSFEGLRAYAEEYQCFAPLTDYDLRMMPYFYRDQLLACDYYGQYYASTSQNRADYLAQARFATKLLRGFTLSC